MSEKTYSLFLPPEILAEKPVKKWSKKEAGLYFEWFLKSLDKRISHLLLFLDESPEKPATDLLKDVGNKLEELLVREEFSHDTPEGKRLTSAGYALAADAGMLVAKCLLSVGENKVFWEILGKPKSQQSFNLPVLKGFASNVELDPIAASIAQASGVLRGTEKKDRWFKIYDVWSREV